MHVGITGLGTWLPKTTQSAAELANASGVPEDVIVAKFGIRKKPVAGPEESTAYMGLEAARKAISMAGIGGDRIDLVIWCGAQHKDYPCWLAGLYVADKIGAKGAWSFDMEAMCGSMMAAIEVAKSLMLTREDLRTVLLVSGYRNNDLIDNSVPATRFMLDIGSGGAALVLEKDAGRNAILASSFRGDGSFSELCFVPTLGTKAWPPAPGDQEKARFTVPDEEIFKKKLVEVTMPNFYAVVRNALARSGLGQKDIDYLAILHFKRSAHEAVLTELGLRSDQSIYLEDYGHIGQNDQVISLELALAAGKVREGSNVVFVGAGLGFVWAATVVRWGKCGA